VNKYVQIAIIILLTAAVAGAGYLIYQNQKLIKQVGNQVNTSVPTNTSSLDDENISPQPSINPSPQLLNLEITQNAIKTNINAQNYEGLISYMTSPTISVILQASECCGPQTQSEAISQLTYINEGLPLNFNQDSDIIKNLKAKNPELSQKYIGISIPKEHLVAFGINSENKIADIRLSVSWKLFSY